MCISILKFSRYFFIFHFLIVFFLDGGNKIGSGAFGSVYYGRKGAWIHIYISDEFHNFAKAFLKIKCVSLFK